MMVTGPNRLGLLMDVGRHLRDYYERADAQLVIEGKILPHVREPEGPFGEVSGYYVPVKIAGL